MSRITRREAIASLAVLGASTLIKPASIFAVQPVKDSVRFAVIGDWGTGDSDESGVARKMFETHRLSSFDFVVAAGDNVYPNGSGRYFDKHFEQPFSNIIKDRV